MLRAAEVVRHDCDVLHIPPSLRMNTREIVQLLHRILDIAATNGRDAGLAEELRNYLENRDLVLLCDGDSLVINGDDSASGLSTTRALLAHLGQMQVRRLYAARGITLDSVSSLFGALREGSADALKERLGSGTLEKVHVEFSDRAISAERHAETDQEEGVVELIVAPVPAEAPVVVEWELPEDPDIIEREVESQLAIFRQMFVQLATSKQPQEKAALFGELVGMRGGNEALISFLNSQTRYVVLLALALLGARKATEAGAIISQLIVTADPIIKLACVKTLKQLNVKDRWVAFNVGLQDDDPAVRHACLEAFDDDPQRLAAKTVRAMLLRERDERMLTAISDRLERYRGSEVVRALSQVTVFHIKERGTISVLRSLLRSLVELQPQSANRLGHYLRGSPNPLRSALGAEIMNDADARLASFGKLGRSDSGQDLVDDDATDDLSLDNDSIFPDVVHSEQSDRGDGETAVDAARANAAAA
ncbi:MAG: hypothetical protein HEQ38_10835 [Gemmatimonas sp.]|nr:hypothetical protein [Gemmatimonas sp.]